MIELCPPALIYLIFSSTQIIIDLFKGLYNTAFFKFVVMTMITILLNALCQGGLSIIAWFIVFIPFILMSVIVTMLLYVFGLDVATGKFNYNCQNVDQVTEKQVVVVPQSSIKVFNPNNSMNPYTANSYSYPYPPQSYTVPPTAAEVNNYNYVIPENQTQPQPPQPQAVIFPPNYSSSPAYVS